MSRIPGSFYSVCVCKGGVCVCVSERPVVSGAMSTKSSERQTADMSDCVSDSTRAYITQPTRSPGGLMLKSLVMLVNTQ